MSVGERMLRVEDARMLTGETRYVADLELPRAAHVAFVRSPHAHARVEAIDSAAARAAEGVIAVIEPADLAGVPPLVDLATVEGLAKTPQPLLAGRRVRFCGEPVAMVLAETPALAQDAAALVRVRCAPLPCMVDVEAALDPAAPRLFDELAANVVYRETTTIGDVAGALDAAELTVERTYRTNRMMAAPIETRGCIAQYERAAGRLTVWSSTQMSHRLQMSLAQVLDLPEHRIRVIAPEVGGAFGQKMSIYPEEALVALAAMRVGRPVRWIEDRSENLRVATHAKQQVVTLEAGLRRDGTILALRARIVGDSGAYSFNTATALVEPQLSASLMTGLYAIDAYEHETVAVLTNKAPIGPYRGVGWTAGHTARELFLDELARAVELDPAELRRRNMIDERELPRRSATGMLYDSGSYHAALDLALEASGYEAVREAQRSGRADAIRVGIGVSPFVEPTGGGTQMAAETGFQIPSNDNAVVTVDLSGNVTVGVSVCNHGQGHETSIAQVAAGVLGVDLGAVQVVQGDTATSPFGMGTHASRAAVVAGGAVTAAARTIEARVREVAGSLLDHAPAGLVLAHGRVAVPGQPERELTLADVARAAYFDPRFRAEGENPTLTATAMYDPPATYSNGVVVAVVEVDVDTGHVDVTRLVAVEDCGRVINPLIVEGQLRGSLVQAVGASLLEELAYGEDGALLNDTFFTYHLPTAADVPSIDVRHIETPSPFTIGGIKGTGEGGMLAGPGAVACAVADALAPLGAVVTELPLHPERVVRLVGRLGTS